MTTSFKTVLLLALFLFFSFCGAKLKAQFHQIGAPEILNFSKGDYRAGTQNWSAVQNETGIVFFGNNKGVLEFDGAAWKSYPLPNHTIVRSLSIAENGTLYIGGQDELGFLKTTDCGELSYVSLTGFIPEDYQGFEDVWKIFPVNGKVFYCSRRALFIWENEKFEVVLPKFTFENFFLADGKIYAQDIGRGLLEWDGGQFNLVKDGGQFAESRIAAILPHENGLLICSDFKGLFLMKAGGIRPLETAASAFLKENQIYTAIQLSDERYAIGTAQGGLLLIDRKGAPVMRLDKTSGLQNNTVLMVFQDQELNLWLGLDNGIDYVKISSPFSRVRSESGIEGTGYTSMLHKGKLYVGTNQGLFYMNWEETFNPFRPTFFKKVNNLKGQVWSLQVIGGDLIAGLHEGAYLIRNDQSVPISVMKGAWKFMELEGMPGFAIEGTYTGLSLYKKEINGSVSSWKFLKILKGFEESARVMEQDELGNIWVSHAYKGLFKIRLNQEKLEIEDVKFYNSTNGLPTDISINVARIKRVVLFTTPKGVFRYDQPSETFVPYDKFSQFFGNDRNIHRLIEDQTGNIWFSADDEFGVLNVKEGGLFSEVEVEKRFFNDIQEELVDGFEHIYAIDAYNVFIATEKGFIHYNPSMKNLPETSFKALVRGVVSISGQDSVLFGGNENENRASKERASFPSSLKSLLFSVSAPFYEHIGQIQFRYSLEGFESEWSAWTHQTQKEFTNLRHGDYSFKVEARNAYGQVSAPAVYKFTILPPWYASLFAKAIYFMLAVFVIAYLIRFFSKKMEQEKEALRVEQTVKLERKEAEFRENKAQSEAEIIRLRNENLKKDILHKNAELASATMHLVQKGEILLKIKNDLNKLLQNAAAENKRKIQQLINTIDDDIRLDDEWEQFEAHFDQVHGNFLKNLRKSYPNLTPKDQKLCAYLRMNLTTKEIAPLMNISVRGVEISRYRLRKKLALETDTNLVDFIMKF